MATMHELAKQYVKRLLSAKYTRRDEAKKIIKEINSLTYHGTNTYISLTDKKDIVFLMENELKKLSTCKQILIKSSDNTETLDLITYMLSEFESGA